LERLAGLNQACARQKGQGQMSDLPSSSNHALLTNRGKKLASYIGRCTLATIGLGLIILLCILFPPELVLAASTAVLAAATVGLVLVTVRSRRE
jgi:hypothetical protein